MDAPPPPVSSQNIENKTREKIVPRKIFHLKDLNIKMVIRKDLLHKTRPSFEITLEKVFPK
jgi:hypothetical protein